MTKSFGEKLRDARTAKGLTTTQIAASTHILVQTIEALEREDFRKIPAPIYGRGFVKLYAECVGMDPKPLIEEFMEIHSGRRKPASQADSVATEVPSEEPPPPIAAQEEAPVEITPGAPDVIGLDLFDRAPVSDPVTPTGLNPLGGTEVQGDYPPSITQDIFSSDYENGGATSGEKTTSDKIVNITERFKKGMSIISGEILDGVNKVPRKTWRIALVSTVAVLGIFIVVWSLSKLYDATENTPAAEVAKDQSVPSSTPPAKSTGKLVSTGQKIPSLYVD